MHSDSGRAGNPLSGNTIHHSVAGVSIHLGFHRSRGPLNRVADAELLTYDWLNWYNADRPTHRLGRVPPIEYEATYYGMSTAHPRLWIFPAQFNRCWPPRENSNAKLRDIARLQRKA